jgi:hypothetical protein
MAGIAVASHTALVINPAANTSFLAASEIGLRQIIAISTSISHGEYKPVKDYHKPNNKQNKMLFALLSFALLFTASKGRKVTRLPLVRLG